MSKKIYLVTSGSYSDYEIEGVFTSRKKAERFILASKEIRQYNEVEESILNPIHEYEKWIGQDIVYYCTIEKKTYGEVRLNCRTFYEQDSDKLNKVVRHGSGEDIRFSIHVLAKSKEEAETLAESIFLKTKIEEIES